MCQGKGASDCTLETHLIKDIKDMFRIIRKLLNVIFSTEAISDCNPLDPEDLLHSLGSLLIAVFEGPVCL